MYKALFQTSSLRRQISGSSRPIMQAGKNVLPGSGRKASHAAAAGFDLLSTPVAEFTCAQIVDEMPVSSVYTENHWLRENFPVMQHDELCPGTLEKTRAFRSDFDYSSLSINPQVSKYGLSILLRRCMSVWLCWINSESQAIQAYQNTVPGSLSWKLRLLELVVMSCHDIATFFYRLDNGIHKHEDSTSCCSPTLFYAYQYLDAKQTPHDLANVAGHWAELRIFGGGMLFDRGQSGDEVSFHGPDLIMPNAVQRLTCITVQRNVSTCLKARRPGTAHRAPVQESMRHPLITQVELSQQSLAHHPY